MNPEWLEREMQAISDRLRAEGATGVIVATLYIHGDRNTAVVADGRLAVADGSRLSGRIFNALLTAFPDASTPLPEVTP